jgi:hypothetical protein
MESLVTVVITSCNRLDLLERTVKSLNEMNDYPLKEVIIIEDSGLPEAHDKLKSLYPNYHLILNEDNIGLIRSVDKAYAQVTTPYVFHTEDDWEYVRPGFIKDSLKILKSDENIMQVWISNIHNQPIDEEVFRIDDVGFSLVGIHGMNDLWHGFTFAPGLRSMKGYEKTKPWTQWSEEGIFLAARECEIGQEYFRQGYRAAALLNVFKEGYCIHIGGGRATW